MWVVHRRRHSHKRIEVSYDDGKCPSVLSVSFVGEGGGMDVVLKTVGFVFCKRHSIHRYIYIRIKLH